MLEKFTVFVARPDWLDEETGTGVNLWPARVEAEKAREAAETAINQVIQKDKESGLINDDDEELDGYRAVIVLRGHVEVVLWNFEL